jgi:hypothetical protein
VASDARGDGGWVEGDANDLHRARDVKPEARGLQPGAASSRQDDAHVPEARALGADTDLDGPARERSDGVAHPASNLLGRDVEEGMLHATSLLLVLEQRERCYPR